MSVRTKVAVVGTGYVGLSMAVLLAPVAEVTAFDIDADRIALLQQRRSPITDPEIEQLLADDSLPLHFTLDKHERTTGRTSSSSPPRPTTTRTPTTSTPAASRASLPTWWR